MSAMSSNGEQANKPPQNGAPVCPTSPSKRVPQRRYLRVALRRAARASPHYRILASRASDVTAGADPDAANTKQRARRRPPHHKTRNQRRRHAAGSIDEEPDEQAEEEARVTALLDQSQATETTPTSAPVLLQAAAATDKSINLDARDKPEAKKAQLDTLLAKAEQYSQFIVNSQQAEAEPSKKKQKTGLEDAAEKMKKRKRGRPAQGHDRGDVEALPGRGVALARDVVRERSVWNIGGRDGFRKNYSSDCSCRSCERKERQGSDLHRGAARERCPTG